MAEFAMRKCGNGWMYCTGECKACIDSQILVADHTGVMPKAHGYWHDVYMLDQETQCMMCSSCGVKLIVLRNQLFNYCPNCGAKMDMKS